MIQEYLPFLDNSNIRLIFYKKKGKNDKSYLFDLWSSYREKKNVTELKKRKKNFENI